jgi:hypothetical protein
MDHFGMSGRDYPEIKGGGDFVVAVNTTVCTNSRHHTLK